jgi:uncharacterized membrane protein YhiD involved in acid resistance
MDFSNPYNIIEIPLIELTRNLGIGVLLAVALAWLVGQSTRLIVDTRQYMPLFLLLIPTMILIITIIKTSIALSLGLVGALSIVRFRTPIKEPEELAYIFIAIAIGLGLGANQVLATVIGFVVVAIVMLPLALRRSISTQNHGAYVNIRLDTKNAATLDMDQLSKTLCTLLPKHRIKQVLETGDSHEISIQIPVLDMRLYESLRKALYAEYNILEISIVDNARVIT